VGGGGGGGGGGSFFLAVLTNSTFLERAKSTAPLFSSTTKTVLNGDASTAFNPVLMLSFDDRPNME
jgi:hypothetical protein